MGSAQEDPPLLSRLPGLLEDHAELLHLECRYESEKGRRRLIGLAFAVLFLVSAFVYANILIVYALWRWGVSPFVFTVVLALLCGGVGTWIGFRFCRRDEQAGEPFAATRSELSRSLQWIQTLLS